MNRTSNREDAEETVDGGTGGIGGAKVDGRDATDGCDVTDGREAADTGHGTGDASENIRVVDRAFNILEVLADAREPLGISKIAAKTSVSKSTAHRILQTLVNRGYAEKAAEGCYRIGPMLFDTTGRHINSLELQTEAHPFLATLKEELNLIAYLGVLDGAYASYIGKEAQALYEQHYVKVGHRTPAYCSSIGKCLLACLSDVELEEALYRFKFEKLTPRTHTDSRGLAKELRMIRAQGWAIDDEEYELGHRCVAAPVFNYRGDAIAAIGVSGTKDQISDQQISRVSSEVVAAANGLSRRMGYME